jgi:DNA repair protein RadC
MTFKIPIYKVKLVRDYTASYPTEVFDDPGPAAAFFYRLIGSADREHTAALFLDEWKRPLGATIISIGTLTSAPIRAREVFKGAVLASAHSLVLSHNHPMGNPSPSDNDILSTRMLMTAGACLGIRVRDHIIVSTDGSFCSLVEAGHLKIDAASIS